MDVTKAGTTINRPIAESGAGHVKSPAFNTADVYKPGQLNNTAAADKNRLAKLLFEHDKYRIGWIKETGSEISSGAVTAGPDGKLYHGGNDGHVYARAGQTGSVLWKAPVEKGGVYSAPTLTDDGALYIQSTNGNVYGFDSQTGEMKFHKKFEPYGVAWRLSPPAISPDGVLYANGGKSLKAYDLKNDKLLWEHPAGPNMSPVEIGKDGTVYFGNGREKLCALDGRTGDTIWEIRTTMYSSKPVVLVDDGLYAPSFGSLLKLNPKTGKAMWSAKTTMWAMDRPLVGKDGAVYTGDSSGMVLAFDAKTGKKKWEIKSPGVAGRLIQDNDGNVVFTTGQGLLCCIDSKNGREKWRLKAKDIFAVFGPPAKGPGGSIFIAVDKTKIAAVSLSLRDPDSPLKPVDRDDKGSATIDKNDECVIIDGVKLDVNKAYKLIQ